jgi:hypothetical protein
MEHHNPSHTPSLINKSLAEYIDRISAQYTDAEFYKGEMRDTGRGEGPSLLITICKEGSIIEEETFYYINNSDIVVDLQRLNYYLDFS